MEENITHFFALVGSMILFVFSLSFAIISYGGLEDRLEYFFEVHSITARKEDATSQLVNLDSIKREAKFEEVFMAIMDLPKYATFDIIYSGDSAELQINGDINKKIDVNGTTFSLSGDFDEENFIVSTYISNGSDYYDINDQDEFDDLVEEVISAACGTSAGIGLGYNSNSQLSTIYDSSIKNKTFSVSYDEDTIYYR